MAEHDADNGNGRIKLAELTVNLNNAIQRLDETIDRFNQSYMQQQADHDALVTLKSEVSHKASRDDLGQLQNQVGKLETRMGIFAAAETMWAILVSAVVARVRI